MTPQSDLTTGVWRLAWICDMRQRQTHREESSVAKLSSAISGRPDIPCFLLLDDPANELLLSVGLGADCILTPRLADLRTLVVVRGRLSRSSGFSGVFLNLLARWISWIILEVSR